MLSEYSHQAGLERAPREVLTPMVYAVDIGGRPTVAFEAASLSKARVLSRELWFRVDIASAMASNVSLWDEQANLVIRPATGDEMHTFWLTAITPDRSASALAYWLRSTTQA